MWGILKSYIASHNVDQNNKIMKLINERLSQIDEGMWRNTCRHVEKKKEEYYRHFDIGVRIYNSPWRVANPKIHHLIFQVAIQNHYK